MRWMLSRYLPLAVLLVVLAACQSPFSTFTPSSEAGAGTGCAGEAMICPGRPAADGFALISEGVAAPVLTDAGDAAGVLRAADDLAEDLAAVSGQPVATDVEAAGARAVIVGTLGGNALIANLVEEGRIDVSAIDGGWEAYSHQVVDDPAPGIDRALVIVGSDMRGAIYGIYDVSRAAGVSPWHWWADVPVDRHDFLQVTAGQRADRPSVRYRGIFLNDENPALYGWVNETYGGFNHEFYGDVFELILRQRGNYLWPAMWGKAFADDDPLNAATADMYGVVIGTSHHEPLMRAHVEWARYGDGPWDFATNADALREFWRAGVARMGEHESLVTIGMRGDGDEAMTEGTAIALLESVVEAQREIISGVTGRPASETPQVWALYKEVQDYFDQGMDVPADVTLLFADDNWGNIRRLPTRDTDREGGYGVYYHFDYVGDPRNYKWLNTIQIERTWEQMNLAWEQGASELWIVNVGDLKPMEFPISYFLDQAWDPAAMTLEVMSGYTRSWAAEQFGEVEADAIAELLTRYTQYNARRKPELIDPDTFSLTAFDEAERVEADWQALSAEADAVRARLPEAFDDAFVQLVWFPIQASANLTSLHIETARNRLWAEQGRVTANDAAARVAWLFARDAELERIYHQDVADGKWNHFMSQTHISYTYWQQPPEDLPPATEHVVALEGAHLGLALSTGGADFRFERYGQPERRLDLFDRGDEPARFQLTVNADWVVLSRRDGEAGPVSVRIDWDGLPPGEHEAAILVSGSGGASFEIPVFAVQRAVLTRPGVAVEADGHVTLEAADHARAVNGEDVRWIEIPEIGRTGSGMSVLPANSPAYQADGLGPVLEYPVHVWSTGVVEIQVTLSPTLDYLDRGGMRYGISLDDGPVQVVNIHEDASHEAWMRRVADSVTVMTSSHEVDAPGPHTIRLWLLDPGLVFQRISLRTADVPDSYLGPPASHRIDRQGPGSPVYPPFGE